jgi:hypothetical protein
MNIDPAEFACLKAIILFKPGKKYPIYPKNSRSDILYIPYVLSLLTENGMKRQLARQYCQSAECSAAKLKKGREKLDRQSTILEKGPTKETELEMFAFL